MTTTSQGKVWLRPPASVTVRLTRWVPTSSLVGVKATIPLGRMENSSGTIENVWDSGGAS